MVAIVEGTNEDFSTLAFGLPSKNTLSYLEQKFASLDRNRFINPAFIDDAYQAYMNWGGSQAIMQAQALMNSLEGQDVYVGISYLNSLIKCQTANPTMQRWIMASPFIRDKYHANEIDGYSHSYIDTYPDMKNEYHPDYQLVMNGISEYSENEDVVFTDHSGEDKEEYYPAYQITGYYLDDEDSISEMDQFNILSTWDIIRNLMHSQDEDPTSITGNKL